MTRAQRFRFGVLLVRLLLPVMLIIFMLYLSWGLAHQDPAPREPVSPWVPTPAPRQDLECWQHQGSWTITCSPRTLECPHG